MKARLFKRGLFAEMASPKQFSQAWVSFSSVHGGWLLHSLSYEQALPSNVAENP